MTEQIIGNRYKVLSKLGSGGSAIVYKVLDENLKKICALKTIKFRQADDTTLVRFQREAKAVSNLRHPNIVSVLDFGLDKSNNPFIVMDYVEGPSLKDYLQENGPLSLEIFLNVFIQISDAMQYTHQHNILHRDLKSANLIVNNSSSNNNVLFVQVLDFGLAKDTTEEEEEKLTQAGVSIGTPTYMSPEQAAGKTIDKRSEVYSLGCVMFESLTGKLPLVGDTVFETINKRINETAPALKEVYEHDYPPIVESLVSKTLKNDPEKRFQSMQELKSNLENVVELLNPTLEEQQDKSQQDYSKVVFKNVKLGPGVFIPLVIVILIGSFLIVQKLNGTTSNSNKAVAKKKEKIEALSFLSEIESATWERGIVWHKKYGITDKDMLSLKPNQGIKNFALYGEKSFSDTGLAHALTLPLDGLGYGNSRIGKKQLKMTVKAKPHLLNLYIGGLQDLDDQDLEIVSQLKELRFLGISRSNFTDNGFKYLAALKELDTLKSSKNKYINGTGLTYLESLPKLRRLTLGFDSLSPEGWKALSKLQGLTLLSLRKSNVDDQAILEISKLKNLEKLDISFSNQVTDKGFQHLKKLKNLKLLYIYKCPNISQREIDNLKRAIPNCSIDRQSKFVFEDLDPLLMTER